MNGDLLIRIRSGMTGLREPGSQQAVGNDECSYSYDTPWSDGGLFVSLGNFRGYGLEWVKKDADATGSTLYAHHKWKRVPKASSPTSDAPTTLGIGVTGGFATEDEKYDVIKERSVAIVGDTIEFVALSEPELPEFVRMVVTSVLDHAGGSLPASALEQWAVDDGPPPVSKYAKDLYQVPEPPKISADATTWQCELNGDTENLWLNLSDGYIGGGRDQSAWGGPKGSNGALEHFKVTGYPLVVKLGTITASGAEVYSYAPDEDMKVEDPQLADHLAHFGIEVMKMSKTVKTTAELEVDANAKFEWSAIAEAGAKLEPLAGPKLNGLVNLGNSCYMNSVLQLLATVPEMNDRYGHKPTFSSTADPSRDPVVQASKVVTALASATYAKPTALLDIERRRANKEDDDDAVLVLSMEEATKAKAAKIAPRTFKRLFGENHVEFATNRQQDAAEYFSWVLEVLSRAERRSLPDKKPLQHMFSFAVEEKTRCNQSNLARYKLATTTTLDLVVPKELLLKEEEEDAEPEAKRSKTDAMDVDTPEEEKAAAPKSVNFGTLLETWASEGEIDGFFSSATKQRGTAVRRARMATFPPYLAVKISRYYVDTTTWEPKKLDVDIQVPETLDLASLKAPARDPNEGLLPDDDDQTPAAKSDAVVPDESIVAQLVAIGFAENGCKRACVATQNAGAEAAMEWVLQHSGDPDFADPLPDTSSTAPPTVDPGAVAELASLGFTNDQATAALTACDGSKERAADWIFSHIDDLDAACAAVLSTANDALPPPSSTTKDSPPDLDDGPPQYRLVGFISHIGKNTGSGHYVAHIRKPGHGFVIFDDEKVAKSLKPPLSLGYLYLYQRIDLPDPAAADER